MEILRSNPTGTHSRATGPDQPAEASLASSIEMSARSVDSELQSRVIEPRNFIDWWSLRACDSGDQADAPNSLYGDWSGADVRPGSKSRAEQYWGLLGRWESLLIVALEHRGTDPTDPVISQAGGRVMDAWKGPTHGQQCHEKRNHETTKHSDRVTRTGWETIS